MYGTSASDQVDLQNCAWSVFAFYLGKLKILLMSFREGFGRAELPWSSSSLMPFYPVPATWYCVRPTKPVPKVWTGCNRHFFPRAVTVPARTFALVKSLGISFTTSLGNCHPTSVTTSLLWRSRNSVPGCLPPPREHMSYVLYPVYKGRGSMAGLGFFWDNASVLFKHLTCRPEYFPCTW